MNLSLAILVVIIGVTCAGKVKTVSKRYDSHYDGTAHTVDTQAFNLPQLSATDFDHAHGFSAGSGLRSIAQGSAHQASSAVLNQHAAAHQAAYVAQTTLAQSAIQAASTALAALAGKEVLVENLEHQISDAHSTLDAEIAQLESAKRTSASAHQSADLASKHVAVLTAALNSAQIAADHAERASHHASTELASQTTMVGKAKGRLDAVAQKLHAAQIDFAGTKEAAERATSAAETAHGNAVAAGNYASAQLAQTAEHVTLVQPTPTIISHEIVDNQSHYKHKRM